jgi:hypothetical protein
MSEPDRDLLALGLDWRDGMLHPPAPCRVQLAPIAGRYLIKILLPNGGSTLMFDIPKHRLKIAFSKRTKPSQVSTAASQRSKVEE